MSYFPYFAPCIDMFGNKSVMKILENLAYHFEESVEVLDTQFAFRDT